MMKLKFSLNQILLTAYIISLFSEGVILPIYAIFVQKIGGGVLDAGIALGIFLMGEGIFTALIHTNKKRSHNQKIKIMVWGWFIWLIGIAFYIFISNKWTLFAAQVFLALGNATADPIYDEEFARNTKRTTEEKEWGFFEGGKSFVDGISAIVGGAIVALFGFNVLIYVMVITAAISCALILRYVKKVKR